MTRAPAKKRNRDQEGKFFLYVFFHSVWSSVFSIFDEE
jgi:hypothetical protein